MDWLDEATRLVFLKFLLSVAKTNLVQTVAPQARNFCDAVKRSQCNITPKP